MSVCIRHRSSMLGSNTLVALGHLSRNRVAMCARTRLPTRTHLVHHSPHCRSPCRALLVTLLHRHCQISIDCPKDSRVPPSDTDPPLLQSPTHRKTLVDGWDSWLHLETGGSALKFVGEDSTSALFVRVILRSTPADRDSKHVLVPDCRWIADLVAPRTLKDRLDTSSADFVPGRVGQMQIRHCHCSCNIEIT